jgi:hypothetical protein
LSQPESNYYVLLTIKNDENNETYNSFKETYYKKEGHKIIYQVDLSDPMNKSYLGDETTLQGDVKDFKFKNSVLLEIENGTIKTILDGSTDIISKLRELTA